VKISIPGILRKADTAYRKQIKHKKFRTRAAIEPCIPHLKRNHSLGLNFLKGVAGDVNNALLAGIGYNLKMRSNQIKPNQTTNSYLAQTCSSNIFMQV